MSVRHRQLTLEPLEVRCAECRQPFADGACYLTSAGGEPWLLCRACANPYLRRDRMQLVVDDSAAPDRLEPLPLAVHGEADHGT